MAVEALEPATFLSAAEKQDIFSQNLSASRLEPIKRPQEIMMLVSHNVGFGLLQPPPPTTSSYFRQIFAFYLTEDKHNIIVVLPDDSCVSARWYPAARNTLRHLG